MPMRYPRQMTLELTAKCNFNCPYCYCVWHEYPLLAKGELDMAGWEKVLDKCASDRVCSILFTGGEVLLRPDLFAILNHARQCLPMSRLSLFTNASLLDEPSIKRFKSLRLHLATSLQGLATYGSMTGTALDGERLRGIVARAAELGWPMTVSMTITSANAFEAPDMFVVAAESGAKNIQLNPVMAGGRAVSHPELMITRQQWESVKNRIRALPDKRVPYSFGNEFICKCRPDAETSMLDKWGGGTTRPCPAGKSFGAVGPNGVFRSCIHSLPAHFMAGADIHANESPNGGEHLSGRALRK